MRYKDSHETLAYKTAELDQTYIALFDLELDHDNIKKKVISQSMKRKHKSHILRHSIKRESTI